MNVYNDSANENKALLSNICHFPQEGNLAGLSVRLIKMKVGI